LWITKTILLEKKKTHRNDSWKKIVIEGYRGADIHGDIALDDIKLVPNCHVWYRNKEREQNLTWYYQP
jgi:hypothetical protein